MRKLTKLNIESLAKEVPVLNELEQRAVLGGTDDTYPTTVSVTDNLTGVIVPDPFGTTGTSGSGATPPAGTPSTETCTAIPTETYPTTTTTTTTATTTGTTTATGTTQIDSSDLGDDVYSSIMDLYNNASGDMHYEVVTDTVSTGGEEGKKTETEQRQEGAGNWVSVRAIARDMILVAGSFGKLDSKFEEDLFTRYWDKKGDLKLSESDFSKIAGYAKQKLSGADYANMATVKINNKDYYMTVVNFYDNPEYDYALGSATIFLDKDSKEPVGMKDRYDFNAGGDRPEDAEDTTQKMNEIGRLFGAAAYDITYGIHN